MAKGIAGVFALTLVAASQAHAGVSYVVNSAGDRSDLSPGSNGCDVSALAGSQCTLRAAIEDANVAPGSQDVDFALGSTGVATITVDSPLPTISDGVDINGYTEPGASPNTRPFGKPLDTQIEIFINGSELNPLEGPGLRFGSGSAGSSVRGLAIGNFPLAGIIGEVPVFIGGNFLGTNAAGIQARPNTEGFFGFGGNGTLIGGPDPPDANLISANAFGGVITNPGVRVEGNYIGTTRDGKAFLGNGHGGDGAALQLASNTVSNTVTRNIIAHSDGAGIDLTNVGPGSLFSRNVIFGNRTIGIDLGGDGTTPNDSGDADAGPNQLQNFPVLTSAKRRSGQTKIKGELDSTASEDFVIEFFEADGRKRQGKRFLNDVAVSTDSSGQASFRLTANKPKEGKRVVATATRIGSGIPGATSEFSKPRKVK